MIKVPEAFFNRYPIKSQVALAGISDASEVLRRLLNGGHSVVAGRLAGGFRRVGRPEVADEIVAAMKAANYTVRETDPFDAQQTFGMLRPATAPIVGRMQAIWQVMRGPVIIAFPKAPGLPKDRGDYLKFVDEIYKNDAYHSLSIEGYSVTPELIERVRAGGWDPENHDDDRKNRDALAARGYWQAFQAVKGSVSEIIAGANPGALARTATVIGIANSSSLALSRACCGPARSQATATMLSICALPAMSLRAGKPCAMPCLRCSICWSRKRSLVCAPCSDTGCLAISIPYPDGNGRMARFLMNAMLASGGYPWTVVRVEDRDPYLVGARPREHRFGYRTFRRIHCRARPWSLKRARSRRLLTTALTRCA